MIKQITKTLEKTEIIETILKALPEWFGVDEYINDYVENSKKMPVFVSYEKDKPIGFVTLKATSEYTAELYCMGVLKPFHNKGYGKKLYQVFERYAAEKGFKVIQVKTVQEGKYPEYDKTIQFYKRMGFYEFELLPTLWDEHNPCQIFIKPLTQ